MPRPGPGPPPSDDADAEYCTPRLTGTANFPRKLSWSFGQAGPARVSDEDESARALATPQKSERADRKARLVENIAGEHDIDVVGIESAALPEQVGRTHLDRDRVGIGIERDGNRGEKIDVIGDHAGGAGLGRRNGRNARSRTEIQHAAAGNQSRIVENIARQRLPAGPGERPVRRRRRGTSQQDVDRVPQANGVVGEVKDNFRHIGRRLERRLGHHEFDQRHEFRLQCRPIVVGRLLLVRHGSCVNRPLANYIQLIRVTGSLSQKPADWIGTVAQR